MESRRLAVAFAEKLRMSAAALGCTSRKEICARFRAVNPATQCDIDRLNKWVQGRSLPRASSVYEDLAKVIGTAKPGHWIASCSLEDFAAELAVLVGADASTLAIGSPMVRVATRSSGLMGGITTLAGAFAAYSLAWSPHFRGQWVRGALRLAAGRNGALAATYIEALVGRDVRLTADVQIDGRSLHMLLHESDGGLPLFMSMLLPGPPASVMCGVMSGVAFVSHETLPSASRIIFVRVPEGGNLDASNRYLHPVAGAIASDLAALGLNVTEGARLDVLVREFIGVHPDQITRQDQAAFAAILDREYLHGPVEVQPLRRAV
jgi:hypothetical protein